MNVWIILKKVSSEWGFWPEQTKPDKVGSLHLERKSVFNLYFNIFPQQLFGTKRLNGGVGFRRNELQKLSSQWNSNTNAHKQHLNCVVSLKCFWSKSKSTAVLFLSPTVKHYPQPLKVPLFSSSCFCSRSPLSWLVDSPLFKTRPLPLRSSNQSQLRTLLRYFYLFLFCVR